MDEDIFGAGLFSVFSESQSKASTVPSSDKNESGRKRRLEGLSKASAIAPSDKKTARDGASASISVTEDISVTVETEEDDEAKKIKVQITEELSIVEKRMQVHRLDTLESCVHEVAVPPTCEYAPLKVKTDKPAKEYKFILDPFQKQAVLCLENHQSVLVSAHTSAGKTVVAEYAIAMSLRDKQRVIYTTPIKALSNQKYRELYEEFQDVGLMTGDITINPGASCLIMTTEILRSMLYRGSEVMREVAWVIFDEIHYMRDKERGVVWEETIILLPDNVHYVFLSATIPNATQFAEWIAYLHKQPCHVVYTDYRPTPLQHYIFPAGGDGIHLVVDEKGEFREENFNTAMSVLKDGDEAGKDQRGKKMAGRGGGGKEAINVFKIVQMIMERNMAPAIVFSFSKKQCEAYAIQMSKLDLNSDKEKELVEEVFKNAVSSLSEDDKKLPQVEHVLPLLKKGIGVHHSGLLPLLKETVEVLFGEGLLKVLFATETFAMGLNMPARTVLFSAARKFDGKDFRWLSSGEFIQMSGRAGRRGIDDRGIVILMLDEKISPGIAKQILKGQPDPLNSAFHLTYNMVLNLLRVEEINPEYMLEKSFYQFQNYAAIPELTEKLRQLEKKFSSCVVPSEDQVSSYYRIRQQLQQLASEMQSNFITKPQYILPFLQAGRLVKVVNGEHDFSWAVVINFQKKADQSKAAAEGTEAAYVVDVLMNVSKDSSATGSTSALRPPAAGTKGDMVVVPILLSLVTNVSAVRLYMPQDLRPQDNRLSVLKSLQEVQKRFPDGLPQLDPVDDMGIKDKGLKELVRKIDAFEERLYAHPLHNDSKLPELYRAYEEKMKLGLEMKALKVELKKKRSLLQMDELKCRKRVLRRLGYATASDVIEMKGRVACEISSADELLLTELLFAGTFNNLTAAQVTALISCVVCQEKSAELPKLSEALSASLRVMQETAKRIARVSQEAKLELDEEEYLKTIQPALMDVVHAWCNGVSFAQVCKMTDVFEGSIIRCMRRLEETLRQMCQAAKAIGNIELEAKFSEGIRLMKRDIVFAASLYL